MKLKWRLYRLNYTVFTSLRIKLRPAQDARSLSAFATSPELRALVDRTETNSSTLKRAKQRMVIALCCVGDPLEIDARFTRTVAALIEKPETEHVGTRLNALVTGKAMDEEWLNDKGRGPLRGLLSPDETTSLNSQYNQLLKRIGKRRAGIAGDIKQIVRLLLDAEYDPIDTLEAIGTYVLEAHLNGEGLALIAL